METSLFFSHLPKNTKNQGFEDPKVRVARDMSKAKGGVCQLKGHLQ